MIDFDISKPPTEAEIRHLFRGESDDIQEYLDGKWRPLIGNPWVFRTLKIYLESKARSSLERNQFLFGIFDKAKDRPFQMLSLLLEEDSSITFKCGGNGGPVYSVTANHSGGFWDSFDWDSRDPWPYGLKAWIAQLYFGADLAPDGSFKPLRGLLKSDDSEAEALAYLRSRSHIDALYLYKRFNEALASDVEVDYLHEYLGLNREAYREEEFLCGLLMFLHETFCEVHPFRRDEVLGKIREILHWKEYENVEFRWNNIDWNCKYATLTFEWYEGKNNDVSVTLDSGLESLSFLRCHSYINADGNERHTIINEAIDLMKGAGLADLHWFSEEPLPDRVRSFWTMFSGNDTIYIVDELTGDRDEWELDALPKS